MMNSTRHEIDPCGSSLQYKMDTGPKTDPYDIK